MAQQSCPFLEAPARATSPILPQSIITVYTMVAPRKDPELFAWLGTPVKRLAALRKVAASRAKVVSLIRNTEMVLKEGRGLPRHVCSHGTKYSLAPSAWCLTKYEESSTAMNEVKVELERGWHSIQKCPARAAASGLLHSRVSSKLEFTSGYEDLQSRGEYMAFFESRKMCLMVSSERPDALCCGWNVVSVVLDSRSEVECCHTPTIHVPLLLDFL
nr:hypothetical protein CFP56_69672 [Quercus suber]